MKQLVAGVPDHVESGPAELLGARGGAKLLRLQFIPFMYATPTFDDVVVAREDPELDGNLAFECPEPFGMDTDSSTTPMASVARAVACTRSSTTWYPAVCRSTPTGSVSSGRAHAPQPARHRDPDRIPAPAVAR